MWSGTQHQPHSRPAILTTAYHHALRDDETVPITLKLRPLMAPALEMLPLQATHFQLLRCASLEGCLAREFLEHTVGKAAGDGVTI